MAWNFLQTELDPARGCLVPHYGQGRYTYVQAKAEVQSILDESAVSAKKNPAHPHSAAFIKAAETWRAGTAKDDVLRAGPFMWALYEHPDDEDPGIAAQAWLDDFMRKMRQMHRMFGSAKTGAGGVPSTFRR